jgi:hypothetical protein
MPKIARIEDHDRAAQSGADKLTKISRSATEQGADAARESIERVRASATDAVQNQQQILQQTAGESAELGRAIVDLLGQQTRHNMQVATAFGRVMNLAEVAEIQRDFLAGSFNRMNQLGERYCAMMQAGMKSMAFPTRR